MIKNINSFQEQFLDKLVKQAGFSPDEAVLIKDDIRPILQERIMLFIYRELDDEGVNMVTTLLEQEKYDELTGYLNTVIPNFDDFMMEIYAQFEDEYLDYFDK